MKNLIALGFLIFAVVLMSSIIKGVFQLPKFEWKQDGRDGMRIIKLFKVPLITFALFFIYVMFVVPYLDSL